MSIHGQRNRSLTVWYLVTMQFSNQQVEPAKVNHVKDGSHVYIVVIIMSVLILTARIIYSNYYCFNNTRELCRCLSYDTENITQIVNSTPWINYSCPEGYNWNGNVCQGGK